MKACSSCPARHQADNLEALAETAHKSRLFRVFAPVLRERAKAIREAGCGWWWIVPYKHKVTGLVKEREVCGREVVHKSLGDFAEEIQIASGTVQADRGEQKKALDAVETAAQEIGLPPVMQHLAQIGLRAATGHRIEEKRRDEIAAGEEEG